MDKLSPELLRELLSAVGDYLGAADEFVSIVVVGGATLSILGWVQNLLALEPSEEELAEAREWAEVQDRGDHHEDFIESVIDHVQRDLGRDG